MKIHYWKSVDTHASRDFPRASTQTPDISWRCPDLPTCPAFEESTFRHRSNQHGEQGKPGRAAGGPAGPDAILPGHPAGQIAADAVSRTGIFLQVVFKGLGSLDDSVETLLSESIRGYVMEEI